MNPTTVSVAKPDAPASQFPISWLLARLRAEGRVPPESALVSVEKNVHASTHSSKIITLIDTDNRKLRLFCKYGEPSSDDWLAHGHRGGVSYEAAVYQKVLDPLKVTVPDFYGAFHHAACNEHYLATEHLENALAVSRWRDPLAMPKAARWLGTFHAMVEDKAVDKELRFLNAYDREYYIGWSRRTQRFCTSRKLGNSWLTALRDRYETFVDALLSAEKTIIHGEYYPKNVLFQRGVVRPVDWESAAVGAGEIDLASLVHLWPSEVMFRCAEEYSHARWDRPPSEELFEILMAGQLYWRFRWLGDRNYWGTWEAFEGLLEKLQKFAEENFLI